MDGLFTHYLTTSILAKRVRSTITTGSHTVTKVILVCKTHQTVADSIHVTTHRPVYHCPCCTRLPKPRPYDEYDLLQEKYGLSRPILDQLDAYFSSRPHTTESMQAFIKDRLHLTPKPSTGYHPQTVQCHDCGSRFRFHHTGQSTTQSPPRFCVYCGSNAISVPMQDNELDYWEVLANKYKTSIPLVQALYQAFSQQSYKTHFADFIALIREQSNAKSI